MSTIDFTGIQAAVFQTARDKGWWDDCSMRMREDVISDDDEFDRTGPLIEKEVLSRVPEKLELIHTEVTEAYEDFATGHMSATVVNESGKPIGFRSEVADIVIRILDLGGALQFPAPQLYERRTVDDYTLVEHLMRVHRFVDHAMEAYRERKMRPRFTQALHTAVGECYIISLHQDFSLVDEILVKHEFNKTRSYKHGNKRC